MRVEIDGELLAVSEHIRDGKTYREVSCFVESGVRPGVLSLSVQDGYGTLDQLKGSLRKKGRFTCEFVHGPGWHRFNYVSVSFPAVMPPKA